MCLEGSVQMPKTSPWESEKLPLFFFTCLFSHWQVVSVEHTEIACCEGFPNIIKIHFIYSLHIINWDYSSPETIFSLAYILLYEHTPRRQSCSHTRKSNISSFPEEYELQFVAFTEVVALSINLLWRILLLCGFLLTHCPSDSCVSPGTFSFEHWILPRMQIFGLDPVRRILVQVFYLKF